MMNLKPVILAFLLTTISSLAPRAVAQVGPGLTINPTHAFAWSENCGWLNWGWNNANNGTPGRVRVTSTCLAGYVWWENTGWMSLGHDPLSVPAPDQQYANTDNTDYGVNVDPSGLLSGYAWSENAGWINFHGGAEASPPNPARFDHTAQRFRGFAWGENIGWINLDDTTLYVSTACPADYNRSGALSIQDIFDFLDDWFRGNPAADFDGDGHLAVEDIFSYLTAWFGGC
jgi:hypothetical protein